MKRLKEAMGPAGLLMSLFALVLASNVTVAFAAAKITTSDIKNGAVTSAKIRDGSVSGVDIAPDSVESKHVRDRSIVGGDIAGGVVGTFHLGLDSVTEEKLAKNSVSDYQLYDRAVMTSKLDDQAVTTGKLADQSVTTGKLGNGAVTGAKVASNTLGGAQVLEQSLDFTGSCSRGLVRGFALVDLSTVPLRQWTVLPSPAYNCTGGTVQVYRNSAGKAVVQFLGLNSLYATVSPLGTWATEPFVFPADGGFQTAGHRPEAWTIRSGGEPAFYVQTWFGDELSNGRFVIMAF